MILKLPVFWVREESLELNETLGIDIEVEEDRGYININPYQITAYYGDETGCTMLEMSDGRVHKVELSESKLTDVLMERL